jgi:hypothetical protein
MIYVTEATAQSTLASLNSGDKQEYVDVFWSRIEVDNPILLAYSIEQLKNLDSDREQEGFLGGVYFAYELLRRQEEAAEMDAELAEE